MALATWVAGQASCWEHGLSGGGCPRVDTAMGRGAQPAPRITEFSSTGDNSSSSYGKRLLNARHMSSSMLSTFPGPSQLTLLTTLQGRQVGH